MKLDPLTQDIWFTLLMGPAHLWKAGSETSVCGLRWENAAQAWDAQLDRPEGACELCSTQREAKGPT